MREKVLRYIRERRLMRAGDRVCVAVSGGADSVALLRILLELRAELGVVLFVAHFNHGLRAEASESDEAFVAELARQHGLEFFAGSGDVRGYAASSKVSIEAAGRKLRYEWFGRLADEQRFDAVATAHTLDDQAETVLLKFLRGAGTRGLAGIYPEMLRSRERQVRIVRPLLEVTRDEVEQYLTVLGQAWCEDESNLDHRFARNRVRHELLPLLEREYNPNLRQVLSDLAELSRAEEEYWQERVKEELEARQSTKAFSATYAWDAGLKARTARTSLFLAKREDVTGPPRAQYCLSLVNFRALPLALQRRVLRRFAETADLTLDFAHVERLLSCAAGEQPKAELPGGWLASRSDERLELRPPQPARSGTDYEYTLPIPGEVSIAELGLTMRAVPVRQEFAGEAGSPDGLLSARLVGPKLVVRNWRPGDRFHPLHSGSEEKLKRLFSERNIPAEQRSTWPLVVCGSQVIWVRGFPVASAFVWKGSGDAIRIEIIG